MRYLLDSDAGKPEKCEDGIWVMGTLHEGWRPANGPTSPRNEKDELETFSVSLTDLLPSPTRQAPMLTIRRFPNHHLLEPDLASAEASPSTSHERRVSCVTRKVHQPVLDLGSVPRQPPDSAGGIAIYVHIFSATGKEGKGRGSLAGGL